MRGAILSLVQDAYLPNLPTIQHDLRTTAENASLTIQINWIVLGERSTAQLTNRGSTHARPAVVHCA